MGESALDDAGQHGKRSLPDRFAAFWDRCLTSPAFRDWAARFPLTRPIARRRTRQLFDMCAGFVYAQVLYACVKLRLFDKLQEGPLALPELAHRLGLSNNAARTLVNAAISLRLASRRSGGRIGLGPLGAAMLGNPGAEAMIQHHSMLYRDLEDPVDLLRRDTGQGPTSLGKYWPYASAENPAGLTADQTTPYSSLMTASQHMISSEILSAYPVHRHRVLMDVGGGTGAFATAACKRDPDLKVRLFDLPAVAGEARERFDSLGLGGRATAIGGDFLRDPLPDGADLISLVRILHDHDDAAVMQILSSARKALGDGGTLLIGEPMSGTRGAEPAGDAYFGFYLLAMGSGRPRAPKEIMALLGQAGFTRCRLHRTRTPLLVRVISAQAPGPR